jgi:TM2 domain/GYF domain 2
MYYVIGANGSQYGPVDEATIRAWVAEGRVAAPSLSFKTGDAGWVPLQSREEFRDLLATAPAAAAPPVAPPPHPGQQAPLAPGERDWLTLLLLAIFVGMFGVDRFYLGQTGLGILKIVATLACGLGLIWWMVDVILIATNTMKDVNGRLPVKR